ncbi:hypothetical protein C0993_004390 [Termitomyces sp. T159_Od127]|nr:hypothetical protein C0993_004390 [Termitomyces sp. T159_Od127]
MQAEVQQLVEMGASPAQARAALRQYKDVMQAAERIFEGAFDGVMDDQDGAMASIGESKRARPATPNDEDDDMGGDDDDDEADYIDYDSDFEARPPKGQAIVDVDPYAGIFFSKDRKEEVIEVEEQPEAVHVPGFTGQQVKLMTQGEWMKGCPEGGEQSFLFSLYSQLSEGECSCPQCGAPVKRNKYDFFAFYVSSLAYLAILLNFQRHPQPDFPTYIEQLRKVVGQTCKACNSEFCLACGESSAGDKAKRPEAGEHDALFHCSNLQGVILGIGLAMLEQSFIEQIHEPREIKDQNSRTTKRRKTDSATSFDPDDEDVAYYGSLPGTKKKQVGGVGYAGDAKEDNTGQLEAQAMQHSKDEKIGKLLSDIRVYLPNIHRDGGGQTSDYLVHPTALAHLRRRFNYICSTLLRNDSLADMSDRSVLYFELLHWLETISSHEALASMMAMPIMVVLTTASAIDRSLRETKGDAFVERLHASLPKVFTSSSSSTPFQIDAGTTEESAQKAYIEWASRVRFKYCDLTIPMGDGDEEASPHYKFYFNNEARMLASSDIPKRSLAIAKELAILTTNLPVAWNSSIFLRVDETRVDVIKALITGPEGTPYHNGCYLFDIFLGPTYNQSPPNVKYMTMLGNLKAPPEPFGDVIRTHFRLKARSIAAQLDRWLLEDDGKSTTPDGGGYGAAGKIEPGGSTNGLNKDVDEVKAILAKLEAGTPL